MRDSFHSPIQFSLSPDNRRAYELLAARREELAFELKQLNERFARLDEQGNELIRRDLQEKAQAGEVFTNYDYLLNTDSNRIFIYCNIDGKDNSEFFMIKRS